MQARYGKRGMAMDLKYLRTFSAEMETLVSEMSALQRGITQKKIEYYTSDEHDRVEQVMYRFVVCWESLWDMVEFYGTYGEKVQDQSAGTKGFLIGYDAALRLSYTGCKFVNTFLDEPAVVSKLNEAYPRCDIPSGTFDKLVHTVTSLEYIEGMEVAWKLFSEQADKPSSRLSRLARTDSDCGELVADIRKLRLYQEAQVERLLQVRAIIFPGLENRIRHSKVLSTIESLRKEFGETVMGAASVLGGAAVHLMKAPFSDPVTLSGEDIQKVKAALRPGDFLLVFSKGYMTNIFIPGRFKHALTYVGTPAQRVALGIKASTGIPSDSQLRKLVDALARFDLIPGSDPDLVEAIGEGVVFNSVDYVLAHNISRMVVLRPQLDPENMSKHLGTIFQFLGTPYDLRFDFSEAAHLCCTETLYRSLNTRGPIRFELVRRMGRMTLSADDIVNYHLNAPAENRPFSFVLLVEEDPEQGGGRGRVVMGEEGNSRLANILR